MNPVLVYLAPCTYRHFSTGVVALQILPKRLVIPREQQDASEKIMLSKYLASFRYQAYPTLILTICSINYTVEAHNKELMQVAL
jgi:hypothetical protein